MSKYIKILNKIKVLFLEYKTIRKICNYFIIKEIKHLKSIKRGDAE